MSRRRSTGGTPATRNERETADFMYEFSIRSEVKSVNLQAVGMTTPGRVSRRSMSMRPRMAMSRSRRSR